MRSNLAIQQVRIGRNGLPVFCYEFASRTLLGLPATESETTGGGQNCDRAHRKFVVHAVLKCGRLNSVAIDKFVIRKYLMSKRPSLSKAEIEIATLVWDLGKATVRQTCDALPKSRKLDFTTVQTYLSRLENKGYLVSRLEGRAKVFKAKVRPKQVIREATDDFVNTLFGGESLPLLRHLISDRKMSESDIEEIESMLETLRKEKRK